MAKEYCGKENNQRGRWPSPGKSMQRSNQTAGNNQTQNNNRRYQRKLKIGTHQFLLLVITL